MFNYIKYNLPTVFKNTDAQNLVIDYRNFINSTNDNNTFFEYNNLAETSIDKIIINNEHSIPLKNQIRKLTLNDKLSFLYNSKNERLSKGSYSDVSYMYKLQFNDHLHIEKPESGVFQEIRPVGFVVRNLDGSMFDIADFDNLTNAKLYQIVNDDLQNNNNYTFLNSETVDDITVVDTTTTLSTQEIIALTKFKFKSNTYHDTGKYANIHSAYYDTVLGEYVLWVNKQSQIFEKDDIFRINRTGKFGYILDTILVTVDGWSSSVKVRFKDEYGKYLNYFDTIKNTEIVLSDYISGYYFLKNQINTKTSYRHSTLVTSDDTVSKNQKLQIIDAIDSLDYTYKKAGSSNFLKSGFIDVFDTLYSYKDRSLSEFYFINNNIDYTFLDTIAIQPSNIINNYKNHTPLDLLESYDGVMLIDGYDYINSGFMSGNDSIMKAWINNITMSGSKTLKTIINTNVILPTSEYDERSIGYTNDELKLFQSNRVLDWSSISVLYGNEIIIQNTSSHFLNTLLIKPTNTISEKQNVLISDTINSEYYNYKIQYSDFNLNLSLYTDVNVTRKIFILLRPDNKSDYIKLYFKLAISRVGGKNLISINGDELTDYTNTTTNTITYKLKIWDLLKVYNNVPLISKDFVDRYSKKIKRFSVILVTDNIQPYQYFDIMRNNLTAGFKYYFVYNNLATSSVNTDSSSTTFNFASPVDLI